MLEFPDHADWKKKLLILAGVQMLDMHYFEWMGT